ncbi:hypothetical protein [Gracilinema caldarium]|uniref:Uncharacterized protein n=1 Tax=Gracilinema caldarium (strain ATCC 51460 / DSM 7334 / H1) TaxID=744872 RepID=F8EYP2_GRAC1|nr:hypothetical protein [Gracilinema caldarium]AEJ18619.1 hypothetical protein Spica_0455 [Gracilinema caldarium DSM 7334]
MWDYFTPNEITWYQWRLDGGRAYLRKNGEEWRLAFIAGTYMEVLPDSGGPEPVEQPGNAEVAFAVGKGKKIALRPHFAKQPYLITVRNEIRLLPGAEAHFTVALPPLLRFELEDGTVLAEKQLFNLSPTWFGDKESGNLCLSLPLKLDPQCKGEVETLKSTDGNTGIDTLSRTSECKSLIHCDIMVRNSTKNELDLKRLAIFTDLMSIYEQHGMLLGDTVLIDTTSEGGLRMSVDEGTHRSRKKVHEGNKSGLSELLVRRGMNFLKVITGM